MTDVFTKERRKDLETGEGHRAGVCEDKAERNEATNQGILSIARSRQKPGRREEAFSPPVFGRARSFADTLTLDF